MTHITPPRLPAAAGAGWRSFHTPEQRPSNSDMNSVRLKAVADRLGTLIQGGPLTHHMAIEFFGYCLSLSRGIDYSVAHNEIPDKSKDLPFLLKQICQRKGDVCLQAGVMVLMLSVKNACRLGWFSDVETQELLVLVEEVGKCFGSIKLLGDGNNGLKDTCPVISAVMSRFYPLMEMGNILAFLEAKPGYNAYVTDFHILKNIPHGPKEKIRLFVVETDNIDTPACIITPQQVNFLLNGKGVEKRTNIFMDTGPQMPTNVTPMLKYGTNLLQAVGQFNGNFLLIIAFMSMASSPDAALLLDYVNTTVPPHSDSDIIEGASRVSLNCPISRTRIQTPVKGHACKHLQCFDFDNYVDINSRRPSWRCPHCNQHVCYTDIRIDQNMVKVLKEVAPNVCAVIMTADGSWKAVPGSDDHTNQACQDSDLKKDKPDDRTLASTSDAVLDLTEDNSEADAMVIDEIEERKPLAHQSSDMNLSVTSQKNVPAGISTDDDTQMEDEFWSGLYLNYGPTLPDGRMDNHANGVQGLSSSSAAVSLALVRDDASANNTRVPRNQFSFLGDPQSHLLQIMNSVSGPRNGIQSGQGNIDRAPAAVQALPVQPQVPIMQQRPGSNSNISRPNNSFTPPVTQSVSPAFSGLNTTSTDIGLLSQLSRSHALQSMSQQGSSFTRGDRYQHVASVPIPTLTIPKVSSGVPNQVQNLIQQASLNPRLPQSRSQPPGLARSLSPLTRTQSPQIGVSPAPHMSRYAAPAAQRPLQQGRPLSMLPNQTQTPKSVSPNPLNVDTGRASVGVPRNLGGLTRTVSTPDASAGLTSDQQNWRPVGRMRGSLTGRQFSEALSELMIQPTQSKQATRPPQSSQPSPSIMPPHMSQPSPFSMPPQMSQPSPSSMPPHMSQPSPTSMPPQMSQSSPTSMPPQMSRPSLTSIPPLMSQPPPISMPPHMSQPSLTNMPSQMSQASPSSMPPQMSQPSLTSVPPQMSQPSPTSMPPQMSQSSPTSMPPQMSRPSLTSVPPLMSRPSPISMPPHMSQPSLTNMPPQMSQPSPSSMPPQMSQPSLTSMPLQMSQPSPTSMPPQMSQPSPTSMPSQMSQPSLTSMPSQMSQPSLTSMPPQMSQPSLTSMPPQMSRPSPTSMPLQMSQPSLTSMPPQMSQPSLTGMPSQMSQPFPTGMPPQMSQPSPTGMLPQISQPSPTGMPPQMSQPSPTGMHPQMSQPFPTGMPPQMSQPSPTGMLPQISQPSPTGMPPQMSQPSPTGMPPQMSQPSPTGMPPQMSQPSPTGTAPQMSQPSPTGTPPQMSQPSPSSMPPQMSQPSPTSVPPQMSQPSSTSIVPQMGQPSPTSMPPQMSQSSPSSMPPQLQAHPVNGKDPKAGTETL